VSARRLVSSRKALIAATKGAEVAIKPDLAAAHVGAGALARVGEERNRQTAAWLGVAEQDPRDAWPVAERGYHIGKPWRRDGTSCDVLIEGLWIDVLVRLLLGRGDAVSPFASAIPVSRPGFVPAVQGSSGSKGSTRNECADGQNSTSYGEKRCPIFPGM
jgi:hypothetical protein